MNILDLVYTGTEACEIYGLHRSNINQAILYGKLKEGVDYKKNGRILLITKEAMERVFKTFIEANPPKPRGTL